MNKLASAVKKLQQNDGTYGAATLSIYKKASASQVLGEDYPRVAQKIVEGFYKQACHEDHDEVVLRTTLFCKAMTKIAGVEISDKIETIEKLVKLAQERDDQECYKAICELTEGMDKEAASRVGKYVASKLVPEQVKTLLGYKGAIAPTIEARKLMHWHSYKNKGKAVRDTLEKNVSNLTPKSISNDKYPFVGLRNIYKGEKKKIYDKAGRGRPSKNLAERLADYKYEKRMENYW